MTVIKQVTHTYKINEFLQLTVPVISYMTDTLSGITSAAV